MSQRGFWKNHRSKWGFFDSVVSFVLLFIHKPAKSHICIWKIQKTYVLRVVITCLCFINYQIRFQISCQSKRPYIYTWSFVHFVNGNEYMSCFWKRKVKDPSSVFCFWTPKPPPNLQALSKNDRITWKINCLCKTIYQEQTSCQINHKYTMFCHLCNKYLELGIEKLLSPHVAIQRCIEVASLE